MAGGTTAPVFYCGIVGYVSGTVVFTTSWTPVTSDPEPSSAAVGDSKYGVTVSGYTTRPKGAYRGTLVISATVDGDPVSPDLEMVINGNAEWDVSTVIGSNVMSERNHSADLSILILP